MEEVIWSDKEERSVLVYNFAIFLVISCLLFIFMLLGIPDINAVLRNSIILSAFIYLVFSELENIIAYFNPIKLTNEGILIPKGIFSFSRENEINWEDIKGFRFNLTMEPNVNVLMLVLNNGAHIRRRALDMNSLRESLELIGKLKEI